MDACGCEERVSVTWSMQQIGPNNRCTVEPCGSTDSFYRSYKAQLWKIQNLFTPLVENTACHIRFQIVSAEVWLSRVLFASLKTFCFSLLFPHVEF